jgi:hypothetical protein
MSAATPANLGPTQADALAILLELEAHWMNVPTAVTTESARAMLAGLVAKQKAFDAYRAQLVAYNQRFRPTYDGLRPVGTPARLAAWCRTMADVYQRAGHAECPVDLLEQVHRCADRLSARLKRDRFCRPAPLKTTADAIAAFSTVAEWCDTLLPPVADKQCRQFKGIAS